MRKKLLTIENLSRFKQCLDVAFQAIDESFIPVPEPPQSLSDGDVIENIVQDYDGNSYNGVVLNNQIWLQQNLRVTHNPSGEAIDYKHPNNDPVNAEVYGLLYDWNTIMNGDPQSSSIPSGVQGIAPNGWHIPSELECINLLTYIGLQNRYTLNNNHNYIAKSLASKEGWSISAVDYSPGKNSGENNLTNLSLCPSGEYANNRPYFFGEDCSHYSSTRNPAYSPYDIFEFSIQFNLASYTIGYTGGFTYKSVRCVMDASASDWFSENKGRLYLKNTTSGLVWSQLSEVAETGSYNDLKDKPDTTPEVVYINATSVSNYYTLSKSPAEIANYINSGKVVILKLNTTYYYCASINSVTFFSVDGTVLTQWHYLSDEGVNTKWYRDTTNVINASNIRTINHTSITGSGNIVTSLFKSVSMEDGEKNFEIDYDGSVSFRYVIDNKNNLSIVDVDVNYPPSVVSVYEDVSSYRVTGGSVAMFEFHLSEDGTECVVERKDVFKNINH